jgi:hypothetical protein
MDFFLWFLVFLRAVHFGRMADTATASADPPCQEQQPLACGCVAVASANIKLWHTACLGQSISWISAETIIGDNSNPLKEKSIFSFSLA